MASILKVDEMQGVTNTNEMTIAASNVTVTGEGGSATMQLQQGLTKGGYHSTAARVVCLTVLICLVLVTTARELELLILPIT